MIVSNYIINKLPEILGVIGIFICLLENVVEDDSPMRRKAEWIYRAFRTEEIAGIPNRLIAKFQSRVYLVNWSAEASRFGRMILWIDGLILIPLHSFRTLPHPFPTWEFAAMPLMFYGLALALIFAFLISANRFLKNEVTSVDALAFGGFLWLANNVLMMDVTFLLGPKQTLLNESFQESSALLHIDQLLGTKQAVGVFMLLLIVSAYLLSSFVSSVIFRWVLPDLFAAGAARHVAIFTVGMGLAASVLYGLDPRIGLPYPLSLRFYFPCVLLVGVMSSVLTFSITKLAGKTITSTFILAVFPFVGFLATMKIAPLSEVPGNLSFFWFLLRCYLPTYLHYSLVWYLPAYRSQSAFSDPRKHPESLLAL